MAFFFLKKKTEQSVSQVAPFQKWKTFFFFFNFCDVKRHSFPMLRRFFAFFKARDFHLHLLSLSSSLIFTSAPSSFLPLHLMFHLFFFLSLILSVFSPFACEDACEVVVS